VSDVAEWSFARLDGRLPPKLRVLAAVTGLVALLVLSTSTAVLLTLSLREHQSELQRSNVPYARAVATAALWAKAVANDERGYLISGDASFVSQMEERAGKVRGALAAALRSADGPEQHRAADEAWVGFERWLLTVQEQFAEYRAGRRDASISDALGPGRALRKSYEASLSRAQVLADTAIRSNQESAAAASKRTIAILVGCLLVGLLVGVGLAVWLVRAVAAPRQPLRSSL
jgi:methyl-accepting chemotaxis protein